MDYVEYLEELANTRAAEESAAEAREAIRTELEEHERITEAQKRVFVHEAEESHGDH